MLLLLAAQNALYPHGNWNPPSHRGYKLVGGEGIGLAVLSVQAQGRDGFQGLAETSRCRAAGWSLMPVSELLSPRAARRRRCRRKRARRQDKPVAFQNHCGHSPIRASSSSELGDVVQPYLLPGSAAHPDWT